MALMYIMYHHQQLQLRSAPPESRCFKDLSSSSKVDILILVILWLSVSIGWQQSNLKHFKGVLNNVILCR